MKYIDEALPKLTEPQSSVGAMPKELDTPQLKTNLTDAQRERLFDELTKDGAFLAQHTDTASFLWAFGGSVPPAEFKPLKWLKTDASLVYLIYELCNDPLGMNNHWSIAEPMFGVKSMSQKRDRYYNNKNSKPNGSGAIDEVLEKIKESK